jgi:uncharacterized cupredoxin-like copper-binding protein
MYVDGKECPRGRGAPHVYSEVATMIRRIGVGALLLGTVALAACSGRAGSTGAAPGGSNASTGGSSAVQNVTDRGTDQFRFEPASLTVRANAPVHLTLDDSGDALVHDFVIDNVGGKEFKIEAQPHGRATGDFTPPPGVYQYYCSQPGHKEAGMVGTLTVS